MDEQPTTPQATGSPRPLRPSPLRETVSTATERIQVIIEAAERAAAGIIEDAEVQARRYLDESRVRADRVADERSKVMTELTDSLVDRAEAVKRQSDDLIVALDRARHQIEDRLREELDAPPPAEPPAAEVPLPEPRAVPHLKPVDPVEPDEPKPKAEAPEEKAAPAPPAVAKAKTADPPPAEPAPAAAQASTPSPAPTFAAATPPATGPGIPSAGARLLATQMAVAGSSREEIESRLRNEFGIADAGPMLNAILGPEG